MTSLHLRRSAASSDDVDARRALAASTGPWTWLAGAALLFFAVPYVGTDLLGLPPDLYYLIYFTVALGWFAMFLASHRAQLSGLWRHSMVEPDAGEALVPPGVGDRIAATRLGECTRLRHVGAR